MPLLLLLMLSFVVIVRMVMFVMRILDVGVRKISDEGGCVAEVSIALVVMWVV
jgi:hypothetical protein